MGLTLAYEGMMLLGAMVATIIVGVITASDLSGVQWDGIISLIGVRRVRISAAHAPP